MTILINKSIFIDGDIIELINLFMSEASGKINLKRGLSKYPYPETYDKAVGLVEVMISFEAFINILQPNESKIWKKREFFCSTYQNLFMMFKDSCKDWLKALKKELDNNGDLIDMTPPPKTRPSIRINNQDSLYEIVEIIYRVRSNMVHGNKTLNSERNQILIINSFHLAYNILNHILREEKILK